MSVLTTKALPVSFFFFKPNVSTQCWVFAEFDEVQVQSKNWIPLLLPPNSGGRGEDEQSIMNNSKQPFLKWNKRLCYQENSITSR